MCIWVCIQLCKFILNRYKVFLNLEDEFLNMEDENIYLDDYLTENKLNLKTEKYSLIVKNSILLYYYQKIII